MLLPLNVSVGHGLAEHRARQMNDWFGAAKKTLLGNASKLLQDMQEYDKDNIPDRVIAVSSSLVGRTSGRIHVRGEFS